MHHSMISILQDEAMCGVSLQRLQLAPVELGIWLAPVTSAASGALLDFFGYPRCGEIMSKASLAASLRWMKL